MISTLRIPRVAGALMLALCGLAFHGAAQAIAIYGASSSLSLTVVSSTGGFLLRQGDQFMISNTEVEQGDGSASNSYTLIPGTSLLPNGATLTSTAVVAGSADAKHSLASSDLQTDLFLYLIGGLTGTNPTGGSITFTYTWTGSATATSLLDQQASAIASFAFVDNITGEVFDQAISSASSLGPSADNDTLTKTRTFTVPFGISRVLRFDVDASGVAVPAPAPLALIAGGLLAIGASRRRAGAGQGL